MSNPDKLIRRKKILGYIITIFLVFSIISPVFFYPKEAKAFLGIGDVTTIVANIPEQIYHALQATWTKIKEALKVAGDVAIKNSLRVFLGKVAEDTAVWLASGAKGQHPLFQDDPAYRKKLFDAAAGDYIATIGDKVFGFDVCNPDLKTKVQLSLSLSSTFNPFTYCEDSCEKAYQESNTYTLEHIEADITRFKDPQLAKSRGAQFLCPIVCNAPGPCPGSNPYCLCVYDTRYNGGITLENDSVGKNLNLCIETLERLNEQQLSDNASNKTTCLKNCKKGARKERCTASTILDNFNDYRQELENLKLNKVGVSINAFNEQFSQVVTEYLNPAQNDIGQWLTISGTVKDQQTEALAEEEAKKEPSLYAEVSLISGKKKNTSELTKARAEQAVQESTKSEEVYTGSIAADMIKIFTNTLVKKLTEKYFGSKCGLNPSACKGPSSGSKLSQLVFGSGPTGIAAAKLMFSSIGKITYISGNPGSDQIDSSQLTSLGLIDSRLQTAIDQRKTVKEALDEGLLDGSAPFGFTTSGSEPETGYPFRTIQYLRKYRVVPVGWELAAKYIRDYETKGRSLNNLVEAFDDCGQICSNNASKTCLNDSDCPDGTCTKASSFCGLVDPNWVLKMPQTYCRRQGSSEDVVYKDAICSEDANGDGKLNCTPEGGDILTYQIQRATDTCVDELSCLQENDDGSCKGDAYGYCFEERNTWRFDGTACPRVFSSCFSYENKDGQAVSYLKKTLDYNGCSEANAGCKWYCRNYDLNTNTCLPYSCVSGTKNGKSCTTNNDCPGGSCLADKIYFNRNVETCNASAEGCQEFIKTGQGVNLMANGGFERYEGEIDEAPTDRFPGWESGICSGGINNSFGCFTNNDCSGGSCTQIPGCGNSVFAVTDAHEGTVALKLQGAAACSRINTGYPIIDRTFTISFSAKASASCSTTFKVNHGSDVYVNDVSISLTNQWQGFAASFVINSVADSSVSSDEMLFSLNSQAGCDIFVDAVQLEEGSQATSYQSYGSQGLIYLNKNRLSCSKGEVGCELYTPVNGDPAIPGIVYSKDLCDSQYDGCRLFKEMPITHVPIRTEADPYKYFIAKTGKSCSAANVGCEEYTNLDVVAQGGEGKEYYSQIRQCVKPDPAAADQATYYTWEGSEVTGFQLRTFKLKQSNIANYSGETGTAPCTNLSVATSATNPVCEDDLSSPAVCNPATMADNPDCREFYDTIGNVFYRLKSRTISVSDNCHPYRNTIDAQAGKDTIYHLIPSENIKCPASAAGCREYKGNNGNNIKTILKETFESGDITAWKYASLSTASTVVGGNSMTFSTGAVYNVADLVSENNLYVISFWAKGDTTNPTNLSAYFLPATGGVASLNFNSAPITLTDDWNYYTLGPVEFTRPVADDESLYFFKTGGEVFIDNIILKEIRDSVYLIKDTYTSCPPIEANCQEYKDRAGSKHYIKSFEKICSQDKVGCQALINTQNSTNPFEETIKEETIDGVKRTTIPKDVFETWVLNPSYYCKAADKGCTQFSKPKIQQEQIVSWDTVYLKNNPDNYLSTLCLSSEYGCEEFKASDGSSVAWFKDPGDKTCEYKKIAGTSTEIWYKSGSTDLCPISTPPPEGIPKDNWVGLCPADQSGCNEYRDPSDPDPCRSECSYEEVGGQAKLFDYIDGKCVETSDKAIGQPGCRSYYYLKQTIEDNVAECGDKVNIEEGCRPFNDTSNETLNFRGK